MDLSEGLRGAEIAGGNKETGNVGKEKRCRDPSTRSGIQIYPKIFSPALSEHLMKAIEQDEGTSNRGSNNWGRSVFMMSMEILSV